MNSSKLLKNIFSENYSNDEKLEIYPEASNDQYFKFPDIKIREITRIDEKKKWLKLFIKKYSGEKNKLNSTMLGNISRFFVGSIDGKDVGFIRITNYTETFKKHYCGEVWNASDAFVKTPYRGQSVLRHLLDFVIRDCNVKMVRMETSRLLDNFFYYRALGFNFCRKVGDGYLSIAVTNEIQDAFIKLSNGE